MSLIPNSSDIDIMMVVDPFYNPTVWVFDGNVTQKSTFLTDRSLKVEYEGNK